MERDIDLAFLKLPVLHHASHEDVFGLGLNRGPPFPDHSWEL